jgi:hypothetical protein
VSAHGVGRQEIVRGVLIGHAGEEHMLPVDVYYDDILQLLRATGTHWTPTLALEFSVLPEGSPIRTRMLAEVKRAYQAGVALYAGTDAANPLDNYGQALQAELQNFARAGIPSLIAQSESPSILPGAWRRRLGPEGEVSKPFNHRKERTMRMGPTK